MKTGLFLASLPLLVLLGCSDDAPPNVEAPDAQSNVQDVEDGAKKGEAFRVTCEDDAKFLIRYVQNDEQDTVELTYDNEVYELKRVEGALDKRYASPQGPVEGVGVEWLHDKDEATLSTYPIGSDSSKTGTPLHIRCHAR
ncbi:MliC family protein [Halomonas sp. WWR20]